MVIDGFTIFGSWPGVPYYHQVEELIAGLTSFKLDRACTLSSKGIFFDAAAGNETTAMVCQEYPHLIPIGIADPRINGVEQVQYCLQQGFRMMALFPRAQGWSLDSLPARAVLEAINCAKLPVLIEASQENDPSIIYAATRDLSMPIILHDVSLATLTEAMQVLCARPDTYLGTRLLCGGDTIEYIANTLGAERLIFTSRFPISCFSSAFLTAKYSDISDEARSAIMGGNILRLLSLSD